MSFVRSLLMGSGSIALMACGVSGAWAQTADATVDAVVVTADGSQVKLPGDYAGGQVARGGRVGLLGNLDIMDTPFSTSAYTEALIRGQQARSVADVLQNDPTVRVARGFGNFQELYVIRGFPIYSDDMTYNGVYGILPRQYVAAEFLERVEVFRGANAFLNGAAPGGSGVGGAVNLVPKRAADQPLTRLSAGVETGGQAYGALDAGRRFGPDGDFGARLNLVRREGETAVENQERALTVAGLGVDYRGERLRFSADAGYQDHHIDAPRPSVTPAGAVPKAPDADSNFAQPWTYTDERQLFAVVRGEYDVSRDVSAWVAVGGRNGKEHNVLANPTATAAGVTSAYRFDNAREDDVISADAGVRAEFQTGAIGHRLVASGSAYSMQAKNAYAFSSFAGFASDLHHPTAVAAPVADVLVGGVLSDPRVTEKTDTTSLAVADMVSLLDGKILATVGARYQTIKTQSFDYNTGAALSKYDDHAVTPAFALVYKATERVSLYANYAQALTPGQIAPATSGGVAVINAGEVFAPFKSKQYEVGAKYDGGDFGGTVSLFSTEMPSAYVVDARFDLNGKQRNRGVEATVYGQPIEGLRIIGGLTLLDAEMVSTQGGLFDGKDAIGVPKTQANVNLEWDVAAVPGLTLDGRVTYTGSQPVNAADTIDLKSWARLDLGARYGLTIGGKAVSLRGRIENVTGEDYWASAGGYPGANYLVLGAPRTVVVSASVDF